MKERGGQQRVQEIFGVYRLIPLIKESLRNDWEQMQQNRADLSQERRQVLEKIWGEGLETPWYIAPSIASECLRWVGYEVLDYKPATPTPEAIMAMMMGTSSHWSLLKKVEKVVPGGPDSRFLQDDPGVSGRLDYLLRNPKTGEFQVLELKFVGDWVFRKITREGLSPSLVNTKGIYQPTPEHRLQTMQYMWAKRQEGVNVVCANIVYINRDRGTMKEAMVLWDALVEYDIQVFLGKAKEARARIDRGELPEPTVESSHVCGSLCPYRAHCEFGQKFAAGQVKKQQKRRPQWVYKKARQDSQELKAKMVRLGLTQPKLPLFD